MRWKDWLEKWKMTSLKINTGFLELDWQPCDEDKTAAWELYIELLTRITTQRLGEGGDELTALSSIHSLFETTRDIIKSNGRGCMEFTKIAVIILNQKIRPFTSKWHQLSLSGCFRDKKERIKFRQELSELNAILSIYTQMLSEMAGVEDITHLESAD